MLKVLFCLLIVSFFSVPMCFAQGTGANSGVQNTASAWTGLGANRIGNASNYTGNTTQQTPISAFLPPTYLGGGSAGHTLAPIFGTSSGCMTSNAAGPGGCVVGGCSAADNGGCNGGCSGGCGESCTAGSTMGCGGGCNSGCGGCSGGCSGGCMGAGACGGGCAGGGCTLGCG